MDKTLKKFLPLGGFMIAFAGGLALHFALALQLLGMASFKKHTVILYVIFEALFFIVSFVSAIILMSRLASQNKKTDDI